MPFIQKTISRKSRYKILLYGLLFPAAILLTAFGFGRGKTTRVPSPATDSARPAASPAPIFQGNSSPTRVDAAHITLRRTGFEPNEITRQAGPFLLRVDNVTGMGEMSFRLLNRAGARVRDFPAKGRFRLRKIVDLPAGKYALAVPNRPEWVCRITITAP